MTRHQAAAHVTRYRPRWWGAVTVMASVSIAVGVTGIAWWALDALTAWAR